MKKLSTIQKRENLNEVHRYGDPGPGGAYHDYDIYRAGDAEEPIMCIQFQRGARKGPESRSGVIDTDLQQQQQLWHPIKHIKQQHRHWQHVYQRNGNSWRLHRITTYNTAKWNK